MLRVPPKKNITPLSWDVIINPKDETTYHIHSTFVGDWRISSAIEEVIELEDAFQVKTRSGSTYILNKDREQGKYIRLSHVKRFI